MPGVQPVPSLGKWGSDSAIWSRFLVYGTVERRPGVNTFREMLRCVPLRVLRLQLNLPSYQAVVQGRHPPLSAPEKYPLAPYFLCYGSPRIACLPYLLPFVVSLSVFQRLNVSVLLNVAEHFVNAVPGYFA